MIIGFMEVNYYLLKFENAAILDRNTGEIIDIGNGKLCVQLLEDVDTKRKRIEKKSDNANARRNLFYERQGGFVWSTYNINQLLHPDLKLSSLTRLIYLSTFLCYKGYLESSKGIPMEKKWILTELKISKREAHRFWNETIQAGIVVERDDKIYLNSELFAKGEILHNENRSSDDGEQYFTRLYVNGVRSLYNGSTVATEHKSLGYIFRIMPYINRKYSVLCLNPLETNRDKLQLMSLDDFADIVGCDNSNLKRLRILLSTPTFEVKGKKEHSVKIASFNCNGRNQTGVFVNPRLYYSGNSWKEIGELADFREV